MRTGYFFLGVLPFLAAVSVPEASWLARYPLPPRPPAEAMELGGPRPDLAGSWVLNPELSRSRGRRLSEAGVDGQGPPISFAPPSINRALSELLRPKIRLTISQTDTAVTVADDAGWIRLLLTKGQRVREELGQGGPAEIESRWKGEKLLTQRWLELGGVYSESYELDEKTGRLKLKVSYQFGRMPRPLESALVYEREPGNQGVRESDK